MKYFILLALTLVVVFALAVDSFKSDWQLWENQNACINSLVQSGVARADIVRTTNGNFCSTTRS